MSTLTAAQLADALRLILEYEAGQHGEPGVIGCKAVDDAREVLAAYDAQTAADKTDCRIPHSKCAPCRNCEPIDDPLAKLQAVESQMREWIAAEVDPDLDRIEQWADNLTDLRAALSARASAGEGGSAEDRFEQYVATLIAKNPDVQKLGERLADWLDEDRFNSIEPILTGIAQRLTAAPQPAQAGASGGGELVGNVIASCENGHMRFAFLPEPLAYKVADAQPSARPLDAMQKEPFPVYTTPASPAAGESEWVMVDGRRYDMETVKTALLGLASDVIAAAPQPQHWSANSPLYKDDVVSEQDARECFKGECPAPYCECSAGECKQAYKGYQRTSSGVKKGVPR